MEDKVRYQIGNTTLLIDRKKLADNISSLGGARCGSPLTEMRFTVVGGQGSITQSHLNQAVEDIRGIEKAIYSEKTITIYCVRVGSAARALEFADSFFGALSLVVETPVGYPLG